VIAGFDAACGFHRTPRRDELLLRSDGCDVGEVEGFDDEFSRVLRFPGVSHGREFF